MAPAGAVLRQTSCGSTPREVIECVMQRTMHTGSIFRGQNSLSPGLKHGRWREAASRGDIQCPAEMLARMTQPDARAVMAADLVVESGNVIQLHSQRRRRLDDAG